MYVRFVAHQTLGRDKWTLGLFAAAEYLIERDVLKKIESAELQSLLDWFNKNLPAPPSSLIPPSAIFWFLNHKPYRVRMRRLANILKAGDLHTETVTARYVGRIIFQDATQVAAIPPRLRIRRRR